MTFPFFSSFSISANTIATWCNMRIGNPPNYDNLLKAYESLKGQLRISKTYTRYAADQEPEMFA